MKFFLSSFFFSAVLSLSAIDIDQKLNYAYALVLSNLDSAAIVAQEILDASKEANYIRGEVQANYILGYVTKAQKDFGASVIYYLEAIRKAEMANYETVNKDRISLRRNIANTFRQFRANGLATQYNLEAVEIAEENNVLKQIIILKLNQGIVYRDNTQFSLATKMFKEMLAISTGDYVFEALNEIGITYLDSKDYNNAKVYFDRLENNTPTDHDLRAMALHNLGVIKFEQGDIAESINLLEKAISIFRTNGENNYLGLFNSCQSIGTYLLNLGEFEKAEGFLLEAEELIQYTNSDPDSFEVYKTISELYYTIGNTERGKLYQEKYFNVSQNYISLQEEIQQKDKEYNFDLIVKRYFDEVERQDQMASVMFYSKVSTGSLLLILILVIAYYQTKNIRTRRSIERELKALKIL